MRTTFLHFAAMSLVCGCHTWPLKSGPMGNANPLMILDMDPQGRWVAVCQVPGDTNGDGEIWTDVGPHGSLHGDMMEPRLFPTGQPSD